MADLAKRTRVTRDKKRCGSFMVTQWTSIVKVTKEKRNAPPRTQYAQVLKTRFVFSVYEAFSPFKCIPH